MIFASDIDRTLIFSYRFVTDETQKKSLLCMETVDNKEISYMKKDAFDKLLEISQLVHVIPVTMRSLKEYNRLIFSEELEYAIVCNGGVILRNGSPLKEWEREISKIKPRNYKNLMLVLQDYDKFFKKPMRLVDDIYFFASIKEDFSEQKEEIKTYIEKVLKDKFYDWNVVLNSNKIYVCPKNISKDKALSFLKKYIEKEEFKKSYLIVAGDGPVDLPMLQLGNQRIIPDNSAILKEDLSKLPYLRVKPSFEGTENLLNIVERMSLVV